MVKGLNTPLLLLIVIGIFVFLVFYDCIVLFYTFVWLVDSIMVYVIEDGCICDMKVLDVCVVLRNNYGVIDICVFVGYYVGSCG